MDIKSYIHKIILTGSANMYSTIIEQEKTFFLPKIKPLGGNPKNVGGGGVDIYGFFSPTKLSKLFQKRMFESNLKKICLQLRLHKSMDALCIIIYI